MAPPPPKAKWAETPPSGSTIIHGMDAAYPPFTEIDPSGKAIGFDVDVVDIIANKYGWKIEHKPWDWSAIITAVQSGDLDFVASGMSATAARSEIVWFSVPYYSYIHQLLALATDTRSRDDILNSGEFVACQTGATSDEWATKLLAAGYKFQKLGLDSYELAFMAVLDGRAVAVISDSAFTGPYFKTQPDVAMKFRIVSTIGGDSAYGYATRPADYGLRNAINHALEDIMGSTDWQTLRDKWSV
jgi:polar amino acid transport system substrate-binding protein